MISLQNKIALVTGASRGIGAGIVLALGQAGAMVIGTATSQEGAVRIQHYLDEAHIQGSGRVLEVTSPESIESLMKAIKTEFGTPHILVNNAAIAEDNLFLRMKEEEWFHVLDTNLNSVFRLTKYCLRDMLKARWGRIISIGSIVGSTGNPGQVNYAAAKAGLIGLTKSLAQEVGSRNITVNVVAPGFIDTDMTRQLPEEYRQQLQLRIPMQCVGKPSDIGAAVVFLASDWAGYITGQPLH